MKVEILKISGNVIEFVPEGKKDVEKAELAEWVKPEYVAMGEAEITVKDEKVTFCTMANDIPKSAAKPTETNNSSSSSDIVKIQGKDFMTYEGLLKKAHAKDKYFSMIILESFVSEDMKRAWCKIRLTSETIEGTKVFQTFDGFGSSTPENTGSMTSSHPIEMAHTRAKGRALRDFLNIGLTMAEELKS